ncbi:nickel responsive regulator [compost metagenome]
MRIVTVKMPEVYIDGIDELVRAGRYSSRSEAIRVAVRELLKRELWSAGIPAEEVHATPVTLHRPLHAEA